MKMQPNNSIGKSISRIGLGCVTFGRETDEHTCFEIMDYALEQRINFFDTAAVYGSGASETIIGKWMTARKTAGTVVVATKIPPPFSAATIEAAVDQSMERLGVDCIELLYLHNWDPSVKNPGTLAALETLVRKGKVGALGVSNFTAQQLLDVVNLQKESGHAQFRFTQNNHNFAVSDLTDEFMGVCKSNGISIVTYSPLGAGFLTGKYRSGIESDSRFARISGHQQIYFRETAENRLAQLQKLSEQKGYSTVQLALGWAFHQKNVTSVLIGARKKEHVDQALDALSFCSPAVLDELELFINKSKVR